MSAHDHPGLRVVRVFCAEDGTGGNPLGVFLDGAAVRAAERQPIATELGFSETVFVDDAERGEIRIFTPEEELPLAGHPLVGTAWLMRQQGIDFTVLRPPPGEVPVRFDGEMTYVAARPEWCPPFQWTELDSPDEVDAVDVPAGRDLVGLWSWIDANAGTVRARVFVPGLGIPEDEATGSAAILLTTRLGRALEIRQGVGSVIHARPLPDGSGEIGGLVAMT